MPQTQQHSKLDLNTQVVTPENIQFHYLLAGPCQRLPAFLVDLLIYNSFFFISVYALIVLVFSIGAEELFSSLAFLIFVGWFAIRWFYGIYFEAAFHGRTPGKAIFKLRVISIDGRPINGLQAGIRNLLRVADLMAMVSLQAVFTEAALYYFFPTLSVGFCCMLLSEKFQRIGDLAAGTMVISEQPAASPWNYKPNELRAYGLAELIPSHFQPSSTLAQAIGLYMENRGRLAPARREEIAGEVATSLIHEFQLPPDTGKDLLLCSLYIRIFMSEQQQAEGLEAYRQSQYPYPLSNQTQAQPITSGA